MAGRYRSVSLVADLLPSADGTANATPKAALDVHHSRPRRLVAGDRRRPRIVGSNDGRVYGLDLASGKKVWEYEAASPVTSSRVVRPRLRVDESNGLRAKRKWHRTECG